MVNYSCCIAGAFKADLFRYCVLLIRGGVYADMDVLLQTNLDDAIANDIGFMTPIDEVSYYICISPPRITANTVDSHLLVSY